MQFNSLEFLVFFPIVCLVYFPLPQALKKPWLLVCSYYFYMSWNAGFALLILFSTATTWLCGFLMEKAPAGRQRRLALVLNLAVNLGILFLFKYFDFFSGSIAALFGWMGIVYKPVLLGLTLPVGISFYTFQALGYSIDVYRGEVPHEKSFLNYALFVSFFPQLVAGPIERSGNFLPQLQQRKTFDENRVEQGVLRMLVGFFKKMVIADGAAAFVDVIFAAPENFSAAQLLLGSVLFTLQIYCDFAGYSDIAIGAAQVLDFKLMQNFRRPYFASSIREFWHRWHISLSGWLRDYVYIPLGGSRKGFWRKQLNLVLTFLISGLWHGASWNFVIWGGLHGLYQVTENCITAVFRQLTGEKLRRRLRFLRPVGWLCGLVLTFSLVNFAYIFFRAQTLEQAAAIIGRIFSGAGGSLVSGETWRTALEGIRFFGGLPAQPLQWGHFLTATGTGLCVGIGILWVLDLCEGQDGRLTARLGRCWFPVRWVFALVLLGAILLYGSFEPSGFYYFKF